jgi:hypothetical protein
VACRTQRKEIHLHQHCGCIERILRIYPSKMAPTPTSLANTNKVFHNLWDFIIKSLCLRFANVSEVTIGDFGAL